MCSTWPRARRPPLAETRSIDDQIEWLDDDHLIYGDKERTWVVNADGTGQPQGLAAERRLTDSPGRLGRGHLEWCLEPFRKGGTTVCGIVGYVGHQEVQEILLSGLEKLEYRGYDSAGISIQSGRPAGRRSAPSATCHS